MRISRRVIGATSIVLLASALLFLAAIRYFFVFLGGIMGDRVCNYQPVDDKGQPIAEWSETVEGVRFSMPPLYLSGSSTNTCLSIANKSDEEVVLLGGQVLTYGRAIEARVYDNPEDLAARTVPKGRSEVVGLYWDFGTWLDQVLGQEITWVWKVRIGKAEHTIRFPMRQKPPQSG